MAARKTSAAGFRRGSHGQRNGDTGKLTLNYDVVVNYLRARVPGLVITRTRRGIDIKGRPFRAYSSAYAKARLAAGRAPGANLWLTGGMVGSFALRSSVLSLNRLRLHFAPDSVQSPTLTLTPSGAKSSSRLSPPHNILAHFHQTGAGNLPKRKWMGLTPAEWKKLAREIEQLNGIWVLKK